MRHHTTNNVGKQKRPLPFDFQTCSVFQPPLCLLNFPPDYLSIVFLQDANNPAWRGLQQHEAVHLRNPAGTFPAPLPGPGAPYWQNNRPPRFLYDHKNPHKPIPAPSYPGGSGAAVRAPGAANMARFPVDPRFAHPPPVTAYRHPFPPMSQPPPAR